MKTDTKETIREALHIMAVNRRSAVLFENEDQNEIDEFIREEESLQFEAIDRLDKRELLLEMLKMAAEAMVLEKEERI